MPKSATATKAKPPLVVKDRVVAASMLPRVPEGTEGKVIHVQGLTWQRYWVWFDNGERLGTLGRDRLMTLDEWERRHDEPVAAVAVSSGAGAAASGGGGGVQENVGPVPGYLIERSRLARERFAAKNAG